MKKKLKLLNEVLPQPEPVGKGGPRARVLRHAAKIAASTAVAAGCFSNGYGVVDPLPNPSDAGPRTDSGQDTGYGVVDPLPTPYDAAMEDVSVEDASTDAPDDAKDDAKDGGGPG
jgi:hypothetical protein